MSTALVIDYTGDWDRYQVTIKNKIDGICHVNSKGWRKLQDYHLDNYLKTLANPHSFLFNVKYFHKGLYKRVPPMARYYHRYSRRRVTYWDKMTITMGKGDDATKFTVTGDLTIKL